VSYITFAIFEVFTEMKIQVEDLWVGVRWQDIDVSEDLAASDSSK